MGEISPRLRTPALDYDCSTIGLTWGLFHKSIIFYDTKKLVYFAPISQKVLRHNLIVTLRKNEFALRKLKIVS